MEPSEEHDVNRILLVSYGNLLHFPREREGPVLGTAMLLFALLPSSCPGWHVVSETPLLGSQMHRDE